MITSGQVSALLSNEEAITAAWRTYVGYADPQGTILTIQDQAILMAGFRAGWNVPLMVLLEQIIRKEDLQ